MPRSLRLLALRSRSSNPRGQKLSDRKKDTLRGVLFAYFAPPPILGLTYENTPAPPFLVAPRLRRFLPREQVADTNSATAKEHPLGCSFAFFVVGAPCPSENIVKMRARHSARFIFPYFRDSSRKNAPPARFWLRPPSCEISASRAVADRNCLTVKTAFGRFLHFLLLQKMRRYAILKKRQP